MKTRKQQQENVQPLCSLKPSLQRKELHVVVPYVLQQTSSDIDPFYL